MTTTTEPIPALEVGERVKLAHGDPRNWWTARAGDERFTILTRQARFHPRGVMEYTIIDRRRGVRGPCNLIGQGWASLMTDSECADLLAALQAHDSNKAAADAWFAEHPNEPWAPGEGEYRLAVEVSYRNNVTVEILARDHNPVVAS